MEVILALVTAVSFGFDHFFIRKGLIGTPHPILPAFITLTVNFVFFLILSVIFVPIELLKLEWVYFFILAGILAPGCARAFAYKSLETLGMSVTTPIINSESLFSVTLAFIF
ncbi:MAG: EamA family transporter [Thermodesulfobacteriota bacterium]|nr:EamA family transporter [Thermodesulfobacteriota bacterium]